MIEKFFDISTVLMTLFSSLEIIKDEKEIELVYDIDATVPKELKGNAEALSQLLAQLLTFVFYQTDQKEVVLSISAPKDFLYEESISFQVKNSGLSREKVEHFLQNSLKKNLDLLQGKSIVDEENPADIHIDIPFKLNELGKRRHYRLTDMGMLGKKVLLICESRKVAQSIQKMFQYFLYEVDVGIEAYKRNGSNMNRYDILLIEDKLITAKFEEMVSKLQQKIPLKYVILKGPHYTEEKGKQVDAAYLIKPVMQESIYELILSLFEQESKNRSIKDEEKKIIVNMEKYIDETVKKEAQSVIQQNRTALKEQSGTEAGAEEEEEADLPVLDTKEGERNAGMVALSYEKELRKFLDSFDRSDVYFRQAVNEKSTWKIKEFCMELEKQAKHIGAQSMSRFADRVSLLFVYDKLDTLPIYTGKYHTELKKLVTEIKKYLSSQQSS
jgi:hypothetical protein